MNFGIEDPQLVIVVGANQLGHLKEMVCFCTLVLCLYTHPLHFVSTVHPFVKT